MPPAELAQGSHDAGDGTTTNLFVSGLAPSVDERLLQQLFGRFGAIASVKVMRPRSEEELRTRGRQTGFVAFMARRAAEQALQQLHGFVLHDCEMRLGWGKAVPLPAAPVWPVAGASQPPWAAVAPEAAPQPSTRSLAEEEWRALAELLAGLTMQRASVREAMVWALDRPEAAREVSAALVASITPDVPPARLLARLFLLSDVLHQSCSGGASAAAGTPRAAFRDQIGRGLPDVFASLRAAHEALLVESRLSAAALRGRVSAVLACWTQHGLLFSSEFLDGLEFTFSIGSSAATRSQQLRDCGQGGAAAAVASAEDCLAALANPGLEAELAALAPAALRRRCRLSGLSAREEDAHPALVAHMLALQYERSCAACCPLTPLQLLAQLESRNCWRAAIGCDSRCECLAWYNTPKHLFCHVLAVQPCAGRSSRQLPLIDTVVLTSAWQQLQTLRLGCRLPLRWRRCRKAEGRFR